MVYGLRLFDFSHEEEMFVLTLSEKVLAYVREKRQPIYLEMAPTISECCFTLTESPSVHVGMPKKKEDYHEREIEGVTVFVPHDMPSNIPLTINMQNYFGYKKLYVMGWKLA